MFEEVDLTYLLSFLLGLFLLFPKLEVRLGLARFGSYI
jgi:hypothetical protein